VIDGFDEQEDMTARLVRLGGTRVEIPADREDRVRRAVLAECRAVARRRALRRRASIVGAVLASAAAALVALRFALPGEQIAPPGTVVATVERVEGSAGRDVSTVVRAGDRIETDATGRLGLRLTGGVSVRIDRWSQTRLSSSGTIELRAGALYVDSGQGAPHLTIATPFGIVRDIGTQFEVRMATSSLRIRVRSGIVQVQRGTAVSSAGAGTELTLTADGAASRSVEPFGPEWAWTAALGPAFAIEGKSLSAFLEHLSREHGWRLVYGDAKLGRQASGIILHGSIGDVSATDALASVLATTGLGYRLEAGELFVTRSNDR
jgi:FecR-like protein